MDLSADIRNFGKEWESRTPYFLYEPWDVGVRAQAILDQAQKDGIDLESSEMLRIYGRTPRMFQSAIHLGDKKEQIFIGPTKGGKTLAVHMEVAIEASHVLPICLQHDKGVDSGVPREIDEINIRRWGRWRDGQLLDFDEGAKPDGSWHCGNIMGIGHYPVEKFAPPGEKFWVLTTKEALSEKWWPDFKNSAKRVLPPGLIDEARGNNGFNEVERVAFLAGQRELHFLSYEMGETAFEATDVVWLLVFDEEPFTQQIWVTGLTHAQRVLLIETPYNGMTWTGSKEFLKNTSHRKCYHATAYDSPYIGEKKVEQWRSSMASWQIEARIWAMHSEQKGRPFFPRDKIIRWIRNETRIHKKVTLQPERAWTEARELLAMDIIPLPMREDNLRDTWEIYEMPRAGAAYLETVDTAAGSPDPSGAGDRQSILITRKPEGGEGTDPIICASCWSTMEIIPFAHVALQGCRYYNNATMCNEAGNRGATNATFFAYIKDWPWFYMQAITNDNSGETSDKPGFDTSVRTRGLMFELMTDYLARHNAMSGIPHEQLLKELAACELSAKGRPDHPKQGSLDVVISWGFALFVWKFSPHQVQFHGGPKKKEKENIGLLGRVLERIEDMKPRNRNPFSDL